MYFARKADALNAGSSGIWQESDLVLPVNYPGRLPDLVNQELESDFDAPAIIHLDLCFSQHENRRNVLTLAVELDGKPVNA
jgi:hypothetical protein